MGLSGLSGPDFINDLISGDADSSVGIPACQNTKIQAGLTLTKTGHGVRAFSLQTRTIAAPLT